MESTHRAATSVFQSANNRVFNSERVEVPSANHAFMAFQSANNRVFNSEGIVISDLKVRGEQYGFNPLIIASSIQRVEECSGGVNKDA